ncbi:MAG: signal recognition particle-docking protein FtsY [Dongiaceae bacterium]
MWQKLKSALTKTANPLSQSLRDIFARKKLDAQSLNELEELLIGHDLGADAASQLIEKLRNTRFEKDVDETSIRQFLSEEISKILSPLAQRLNPTTHKPFVVLMVGVNGSGKTTTLGKLAESWRQQNLKVLVAAGDTFRAAANQQLAAWATRAQIPLFTADTKDSAAIAHQAYQEAVAKNYDVLLIDTAGRLQANANLMAELEKIIRVLQKLNPDLPHASVLILDATVGQNAISQVNAFQKVANVTGLIITKLDGSAKGGVVVAVANKFKLPIYAIGVGEALEDLQSFDPQDFAKSLLGLN